MWYAYHIQAAKTLTQLPVLRIGLMYYSNVFESTHGNFLPKVVTVAVPSIQDYQKAMTFRDIKYFSSPKGIVTNDISLPLYPTSL